MANSKEREVILDLIGRFPQGALLEEIMVGLDPAIPRRTLQRWLSNWVKEERLVATGKGRARRYHLPHLAQEAPPKTTNLISISPKGKEILTYTSRPIQARHPVSYHREFLEEYLPNQTYYLPQKLRQKLEDQGKAQEEQYPAGTYARQIFHRLLIDLSWNSSRLEGNTYSLLETQRLLEMGKAAEGKDLKETQMILNHKAAIEFLIYSANQIGINRYTILNLHTLLSDNLLIDPRACGRLRSIPVAIAKSVYLPSAIPQVIEECFQLLLDKAKLINDPLEQAFFLMVHIPYLQPFDDVNKRTSRLAANIPLIQKNMSPLSFIDVPEQLYINGLLGIYEMNRIELLRDIFEWAYERSCALYAATRKTIGEPDPFRMKHREIISYTITEIVLKKMNREQAVWNIKQQALNSLPSTEQARFIEIVETELLNLHEGNIARYHLSLSDYELWKKNWK